jgi:glycosyltransferase involved in cell wall biosynthesis
MIIGIDASRAVTSQRTGTEAYAYHLIRALMSGRTAKSHRLRLYFSSPPPADFFSGISSPIDVVIIPLPRLWTHVRLAWELRQRPPDIFFTPAHVIPFAYRGPAVATVHDLGYHYFPQAHPRSQVAYLRWSTGHNSRRSRRLMADSQATQADLVRFYATDPAKIDVVYPGVDPALQPVTDLAQQTAVQQKYHVSAPYLLYLGTLQPRKNLVRLIQAYVASGLPHQLVLAGKTGWLAQPILDAVAHSQAPGSERIRLPGFIADEDKAALISGATALLYPSLYEGFGFPILEGQACGTAVLGANSSSLPEIAGRAALLVDPLDTAALTTALQRIATDQALRRELVQQGWVNVQRFTWQKTAEQTLATLEKAAHSS